ncbi:L,D-transpeptidase [Lichenihabitans sp. PAMC28606]|uniref:L,D-transpeptidase n=1 Tax=Lichenihabitans sp. PAMC28606 TaxID=2880932 RepID=UPI001D0B514C|nr:L,D-transpeptidase [Lichenihabitans sp. PAMC28606]UDL93861.1 L,D-transpeptidase [Lichenihabitans sp. PAMC28606]
MVSLSRRQFFSSSAVALAAAGLAGCAGGGRDMPAFGDMFGGFGGQQGVGGATIGKPDYQAIYGSFSGEQFPVLAFDYARVDPIFLRQIVRYQGPERPGTVVVDPKSRYLFFVEPDQRATRYGVGVGREGFLWNGVAQINMRRSWPDWIPPKEMVDRDPDIRAQLVSTKRGLGVPGGSRSPLGARALYLFGKTGDLGYRIHGTTEPETIGSNVSSGCIRMVNQDVIHLYSRAPEGTKVIVLG